MPSTRHSKARFAMLFLIFLSVPAIAHAQLWSGTLSPTSGSSPCTPGDMTAPGKCAIDWSTAGVIGGIPKRTTICSTINASTYGNGSTNATEAINKALRDCPANEVVSLSAGTFLIDGNIEVPSNVTLRGQGADQTILNAMGLGLAVIEMGHPGLATQGEVSITSGATAGSTSLTLASAPPRGFAVGGLIAINELNPSYVSIDGSAGACTYCDAWSGTRSIGQMVEITGISGHTLTISPGLYIDYSAGSPLAVPLFRAYWNGTATVNAGVEDLQVHANHTGYGANFSMQGTANCWLKGVEGNYTDGDHVDIGLSLHDGIENSYFSNAFLHTSGIHDSDIMLATYTSGTLIQNNILERLHDSVMLETGAAGNVIAYNYMLGNFSSDAYLWRNEVISFHGAHPMLNLIEGNESPGINLDGIHGSSSDNTFFRNWFRGASESCMPFAGRGAVTCTPFGQPAAAPPNTGGINGWWQSEGVETEVISFLSNSNNSIGNVLGDVTMGTLHNFDIPTAPLEPQTYMAVSICGPSPCGASSLNASTGVYDYVIGYGKGSDDGTGGTSPGAGCNSTSLTWTCHSLTPYKSFFIDGDFASVKQSVMWAPGYSHTLPASFYLKAKPSWWGNTPWPAIGPNVTGGLSDAFGHAYAIPAMRCYQNVMGGTDGSGSPLTFNSAKCYDTAPNNLRTTTIK